MSVCKGLSPVVVVCSMLLACQSQPQRPAVQSRSFVLEDLAKADVDMVADVNVRQSLRYLRELARKLYVRNPKQLQRGHHASIEVALDALFGLRRLDQYPGLSGRRSSEAIQLAFDETYAGDRVAAFIEGMRTMLLDAYGGKQQFYVHDLLDPQKLYYLARNFEIAFWKLGHDRRVNGELFLLSNSLDGSGDLSFERIAGKLIALQDNMAQITADSTKRRIKNVIQGVASAVFFPI